jgi:uncharacterized protein YjbI with pentapeptide repeats
MFEQAHVARLLKNVSDWNEWRASDATIVPKLAGADLAAANLQGADLRNARMHGVNLNRANLHEARLDGARLGEANLSSAKLEGACLGGADLSGANLRKAALWGASLSDANLAGANLSNANLGRAALRRANLEEANLSNATLSGAQIFGHSWDSLFGGAIFDHAVLRRANLSGADLKGASLTAADLRGANLSDASLLGASLPGALLDRVVMINTDLRGADLTGASIYGISAWSLQTEGTKQRDLLIRRSDADAPLTLDDIEVAQFISMMLDNRRIRNVISKITSKVVLILGRFTAERKAVLDALRDELRRHNYLPVIFDFEQAENRDLTETVGTLAHLARFVIADLTDAKSLPQELATIVPALPSVPVQPILLTGTSEYSMFEHFVRYPSVLPVVEYPNVEVLLGAIEAKIIHPAEERAEAQISHPPPPRVVLETR